VPVLVDEMPEADESELDGDIPAGAVPCPECGEYFKSRGLSRHLNSAHGIEPARKQATGGTKVKGAALAVQWAEFQRGAALFVSFACTACAAVLVEDAETDGVAIAAFCENRPKLRKQIQQALGGMDVMILVGALGGTARKMIAHHSIGARLGMGDGHTHAPVQGGPQEKLMGFLTQMDEDSRNALLNQVFAAQANATANTSAPVTPTVTVVMDDEVPGTPPVPVPDTLTEQDRYQMAMAHSGNGDFVETL
jgi:uncharacterized C2H2 Zn-finger protein